MKGIENTKTNLPELKNDGRMYVYLQGNYFKQNSLLNTNTCNMILVDAIVMKI